MAIVDFFRAVRNFEVVITNENKKSVATVVSPNVNEIYIGNVSNIFFLMKLQGKNICLL